MKRVKIVVTHKAVYVEGVIRKAGDIVEVGENTAKEMIGFKRATKYIQQKPPEAKGEDSEKPKAQKKGGTTE